MYLKIKIIYFCVFIIMTIFIKISYESENGCSCQNLNRKDLSNKYTENSQDTADPNFNQDEHCPITSKTDCSESINRNAEEDNSNVNNNLDSERNIENEFDINDMTLIEHGDFEMGSNDGLYVRDKEGPIRNVTVKSFYIDKYAVSNSQFQEFIRNSGYKTDAEKFGNSFVFDKLLPKDQQNLYQDVRALHAKWWIKLDAVTWDHPEGPDSNINDRLNHPVVHVSWDDAIAFCKYYNKRLPTEEEWEKACRGGLRQKLYPWGNNFNAKNIHRANIWHGEFPLENTADDGYFGTCPVDSYPPNNFDLYNMVGNAWEWTSTHAHVNPKEERIKKGGSFMCHKSYCYRYRCAARSHNTRDSTSSNMGFRCAASFDETAE